VKVPWGGGGSGGGDEGVQRESIGIAARSGGWASNSPACLD